jgi:hypothetical protein
MSLKNAIRADYDASTIIMYQAYSAAIALPALQQQRFVTPFSLRRMTWIKPSFLWLMERSNWGQKPNQEHILAVRITREGWEEALSLGVLTSYESKIHASYTSWQQQFEHAHVHIQWDPDRSLRGADLGYNAIQVGLSRHVIERFVNEWVVEIVDYTARTKKIRDLLRTGRAEQAKRLLPSERLYPIKPEIARRLDLA